MEDGHPTSVEVLALAVILEEADRLDWKDAKLCNPNLEYSLPLFIVTVSLDR